MKEYIPSELTALAQRLAGESAYERGIQIYESNQIFDLRFTDNRVSAKVQGTKLYSVDFSFVGDNIDGGCSCPASEGFDFCKHCVAVLLSYSDAFARFREMSNGPPARRVQAYVNRLSQTELQNKLLQLINTSPSLLEHWVLKADLSSGKQDLKDLKKHLTKALPLRDIWRHDRVKDYFDKALKQVAGLFEVMNFLNKSEQFQFCTYALERYDKILERLDDSGGYRVGLFSLMETEYAKAFQALDWDCQTKASYLLELYNTDYTHITFESIPQKFIGFSDTELQEAYVDLLKRHVDQKLAHLDSRKTSETLTIKQMTNHLVEHFISKHNKGIALYYMAQSASNIDEYFSVITLALELGELAIAQEYLQLANQQVRMDEDKLKLDRLRLDLLMRQKKTDDAIEIAWRIYGSSYNIEDLQTLEALYKKSSNKNQTARIFDKAQKALLNEIEGLKHKQSGSRMLRTLDRLIEFYLYAGRVEKALALSKQYELPIDTLHDVAHAAIKIKPKAAFNLYRQICLLLPQLNSSKDYEHCIELLSELSDNLPHEVEYRQKFNHLLAELTDVFTYKQAFVNLLNDTFPNSP
ncbi:SWIM zinc finger family protein [Ningiella sp. W23]|uniref:SWIM zinc finger family protein n=1 Tax=Ningiella sp. W23 TaxID=3023715 RepID=UPI003756E218